MFYFTCDRSFRSQLYFYTHCTFVLFTAMSFLIVLFCFFLLLLLLLSHVISNEDGYLFREQTGSGRWNMEAICIWWTGPGLGTWINISLCNVVISDRRTVSTLHPLPRPSTSHVCVGTYVRWKPMCDYNYNYNYIEIFIVVSFHQTHYKVFLFQKFRNFSPTKFHHAYHCSTIIPDVQGRSHEFVLWGIKVFFWGEGV